MVAALWLQGRRRAAAPVLATMPSGWRNARLPLQQVALEPDGEVVEAAYARRHDGALDLGDGRSAIVHHWTPCSIDVEIDRVHGTFAITARGNDLYVQAPLTTAHLRVQPRFTVPGPWEVAGGFVAPMPGVVLDVRVTAGQTVSAGSARRPGGHEDGAPHAQLPANSTVAEVRVTQGQQVENGALLLVFDPTEAPIEEAPSA